MKEFQIDNRLITVRVYGGAGGGESVLKPAKKKRFFHTENFTVGN